MTKETLEEAAKNKYPIENTGAMFMPNRHEVSNIFRQEGFIDGANWQAERISLMEIELNHTKTLLESCEKALEDRDKKADTMYSEEDMREAFNVARHVGRENIAYEFDEWFNKHKKK